MTPNEPNETLSIAGNVPKPKHVIMRAPEARLPLAKDQVKVEYTKPQGNHPHKRPRLSAFDGLFIGNSLLVNGDIFDHKKIFEPINHSIKKINNRRVELFKIPYWYLRISAKQIMLRNIRLTTFIKAIFQFNIIFSIIRNSNFIAKFLVIIESIVNTLWYSFILTIKPKK